MVIAIITEDGREIARTNYANVDDAFAQYAEIVRADGSKVWEQTGCAQLTAKKTRYNGEMVCTIVGDI